MPISKIILNGVTQMDVTQDTVDSDTLLSNETATKKNGQKVTGMLVNEGGTIMSIPTLVDGNDYEYLESGIEPIPFSGYVYYKGANSPASGDWENKYHFNNFTTYNNATATTGTTFAVGLYNGDGISKTNPDDFILIIDSQQAFTSSPVLTSTNHWGPTNNNAVDFASINIAVGRNVFKLKSGNSFDNVPGTDYKYFWLRDLPTTINLTVTLLKNTSYLMAKENELYGKKWIAYGDSITGQGKWQYIIYNTFGLTYENHGVGGSCVAHHDNEEYPCFCEGSRISAIPTDTDIITVMGGTNDFGQTADIGSIQSLYTSFDRTTFMGALAYVVKSLQARAPHARIILMSNPNTRGTTGQTSDVPPIDQYGHSVYDFAKATREVAEFMSVDYIDVYNCGINTLNRTTYVDDTVHPNVAGGKLIGRKVLEFFQTIKNKI